MCWCAVKKLLTHSLTHSLTRWMIERHQRLHVILCWFFFFIFPSRHLSDNNNNPSAVQETLRKKLSISIVVYKHESRHRLKYSPYLCHGHCIQYCSYDVSFRDSMAMSNPVVYKHMTCHIVSTCVATLKDVSRSRNLEKIIHFSRCVQSWIPTQTEI